MARTIFISLTVHDTPIAEALREAFQTLFGEALQVQFSSSNALGDGIGHGEDWFQWIVERVKTCDWALILITPSSVNKPWILWEAGAVAGAAMATSSGSTRKVRPLVYQVPNELIPSPIRDSKMQFRRGDNEADFEFMLNEMLTELMDELPRERIPAFGKKVGAAVQRYLEQVQHSLLNAPAVTAPAVIEEWRLRLDDLMRQNRASEAEHLQDWMDLSFGRGDDPQPLDLRIHSRLADLYIKSKNYPRAIAQLKLALQMAPRDIYILRQLGRALLDHDDRKSAREVLDRIEALDPRAMVHNAECAALAARWWRVGGNLKQAESVVVAALEADARSYYLANLLAEIRLDDGRSEAAAEAYRRALDIICKLGETNVWVLATAANAAFFLGEDDETKLQLRAIAQQRVDPGTWGSIERGLQAVAARVDNGYARLAHMLAEARG